MDQQLPLSSPSMSDNYYQYKFSSPDPLYARIKEEMRSYFNAGLLDDLMFAIYLRDCLRKLGKSSYEIQHTVLFIDCFEAILPPAFLDVREAWATWDLMSSPIRIPGSYYENITTVLNKPYDPCNPALNCDPCNPDIVTVVAKTNTYFQQKYRLKHLLTPGNINTRGKCGHGSLNFGMHGTEKFHIQGNKFTTEFREGDVYLLYYAESRDCSGNQLVPENYRIEQYIISHIKAKMYEQLLNMDTGNTYSQSMQLYQLYSGKADEDYIKAKTEIMKQTVYQKAYSIFKDTHRNNIYERMLNGNYYNRFPGRRRPGF